MIYLLVFLDLVLKGICLYKSARKDQKVWFILLLIVNSFGILPIIYLLMNKDVAFTGATKPAAKKAAVLKKKRK